MEIRRGEYVGGGIDRTNGRICDTLNGCRADMEFNSCSYLSSNALLLPGRSNDIILLIISK